MDIATVQDNVAKVVAGWMPNRAERLTRRGLDPADFRALAEAGFTLTGAPAEIGGVWQGRQRSTRPVGAMLRGIAQADPSVALVAAMHPMVLQAWLSRPDVPIGDREAAFEEQRAKVFDMAKAGHWFGTISSEPGSGGDVSQTRTTARRDETGTWRLTGDKHMGSGSGVTSFMVTVAVPDGADAPHHFLLDTRDMPWDGSKGITLVREWDGIGMGATQSHAFRFEDVVAERHALAADGPGMTPRSMAVGAYFFSAAVIGVVDAAIAEARRRLSSRADTMAAFERVSWTKAVNDHWLADQAFDAIVRSIEADLPDLHAQRGKLALAELAESVMQSIARALGGVSLSRSAPFGQWSQDVRALGLLRPPWALAYDQLFAKSFEAES